MKRRDTLLGLAAAAVGLAGPDAFAQGIAGSRTAKLLVGYPAAGAADFAARVAAEGLQAAGIPVIVENRPGAGGNIALEYMHRLPADAVTFGVFPNSVFTTNRFVPQLASKAVDVTRDVVPVAPIADLVLALAVSTSSGITDLDDFLAKARAPGQRLRLGAPVAGSPHHLSALLLQQAAGLDVTFAVYKGGAQMVTDAAGGHLDAIITSVPVAGPMVAAGKLRWIGIVQPEPVPSLPGVPSLVKVFKGATIPSWIGVWAPASAPAESLTAMNAAIAQAVRSPAIAAKFRGNGMEPLSFSRAENERRIAEEAAFMRDFLGRVKVDFQA